MWGHTTLAPPQCLSRYLLISTFCSHIIYCRGCSRWRGLWVRCCRACTCTSRTALWLGCSWGHPTIIHDAYTMCAAARAAAAGPRLRIHHPHSYHLMQRGHQLERGTLGTFLWVEVEVCKEVKMYCPSNKHTYLILQILSIDFESRTTDYQMKQ